MSDTLRTLIFEQASARAQIVRLDETWRNIVEHQHVNGPLREVLGQLVAASAMLSASLKFEGSIVLQIQGDGPVRLIVAECNSRLGLRATVKLADENSLQDNDNFQTLVNRNGKGIFALMLDPRNKQPGQAPYQGLVPITGTSVAESLVSYMRHSEQLDTALVLNADNQSACGIMIQQMPTEGGHAQEGHFDSDGWPRLQMLLSTLGREEHLQSSCEDVSTRLFWEEQPKMLADRQAQFECTCSREKVSRMLSTLGANEIHDTLKEQSQIDIQCDFCARAYTFTKLDCIALFPELADRDDFPEPPTLH